MTPEETPVQPHVQPTQALVAQRSNLGIPVAIVIAAVLIAGAIYMGGLKSGKNVDLQGAIGSAQDKEQVTPEIKVAPVTEKDHVRGNPNADILIVEYSDYECPFCKNFHETMQKLVKEYGSTGKVAWVYRHFPLEQLHVNAPKIAAASECVAEQGGNDAFWKFTDLVFGERAVNEKTDMSKLPQYAEKAGVDKNKFELCFSSNKHDTTIKDAVTAALATGARGTPYSILMVGDQQGVINGAQPYEVVKQMIDNVVTQMEGGTTVK